MIVSAIEGKSMPQKDVSRLLRVQPQKLASTDDTVHRIIYRAKPLHLFKNIQRIDAENTKHRHNTLISTKKVV